MARTYAVVQPFHVGAAATQTVTADCESGDTATGGGFNASFGVGIDLRAAASFPRLSDGMPVGWRVVFVNDEAISFFVAAFVVCADASL